MAKTRTIWALFVTSLFIVAAGVGVAADSNAPQYTIPEVMDMAHKKGLMKKVASGQGSAEDAKTLLAMYQALAANTPPKGSEADWKERTAALIEATKAVIDNKPGAGTDLTKAANCMACHKEHKG
jgi:surface antigen